MRKDMTYTILTNEELKGLRPRERGRYVQNLILNTLDEKKDFALSEIIEKTGLARATITKHVDNLVSTQQVIKDERQLGRMQIAFYRRTGSIEKKEEIKSKDNESSYSFFVLDNDDGGSVCIQQKEVDEYENSIVKGAITIKFEDLQSFITEFHAYGARVVDK
jgi:hypothetical protein